MPWPSLLSPSLLKAPSARTSEDCFIIAVSNSLSLHPFEQAAAVLLPCLQTQSLELITTMKSSAMGDEKLMAEMSQKALNAARPNASADIISHICSLIGRTNLT